MLITTVGYPGSGKTHFAIKFCAKNKFVHLNSDKLRLEMFANPNYTPNEHAAVFGAMDYMTELLLDCGTSVFYDANNNKLQHRESKRRLANEHGAKYLLIWFKTPLDTAASRVKNRSRSENDKHFRNIDSAIVHRMAREIELPTPTEAYTAIDGMASYAKQINTLNRAASATFL